MRVSRLVRAGLSSVAILLVTCWPLIAQVSQDDLLRAAQRPQDWLMYSGGYASQRYSELRQITPQNVRQLEQQWILQTQVFGSWEATPLVVDGVMYVTQRPNDVVALDARTGRIFWVYRYVPLPDARVCCGSNNRGLAIAGDTLFMGTLDAHVIAIDARNGIPLWKTKVIDQHAHGYSITAAPLVVKDKVIVGVGGGEFGIRGFIAAFDVKTGREQWRFHTVPAPGERGSDTWKNDAWKTGGGSIWVTGSYDPSLNLTYWGIGNPGPDYYPAQRPGDNLYTASVVALDADTGTLRWHFQFTPNDGYDFDATQIPVLVDRDWGGAPAKLMLWANRNGFYYVLDRATGKFLLGTPFVKVNWASGLDENGRPIQTPQSEGAVTWPGIQGGTNWYSPSYSPRTGLFYVSTWENYSGVFSRQPMTWEPGRLFMAGGFKPTVPAPEAAGVPNLRRGPINNWTDAVAHGGVAAIDPATGQRKWTYRMYDATDSGILTTASDLLFTGGREGFFQALDARTGELLWRGALGGQVLAAPITYEVAGKQFVAIIAGNVLASYALRD